MGRKTKLTPEVQDLICQAIRAGNYARVAAAYAGITEATYYNWLKRGETAKSGLYFDFFEAVKKAEADAQTRNVAIIQQAAKKTWQAAAWWLERKFPNDWGKQVQEQAHTGEIVVRIKRENKRD